MTNGDLNISQIGIFMQIRPTWPYFKEKGSGDCLNKSDLNLMLVKVTAPDNIEAPSSLELMFSIN